MSDREVFEGWGVLEVMGHRRLGGYLREQEIAGHGYIRIDVPATDNAAAMTQFYSPGSVYAITPVTEEIARAAARRGTPEPVHRWELLPEPKRETRETYAGYGDEDETDPDDMPFE